MEVLVLFSSLNKIGLVAFLITFAFLVYEIVMLKKSGKPPEKPAIPQFQEGLALSTVEDTQSSSKKIPLTLGRNKAVIIVLTVMVVLFGSISLIGLMKLRTPKKTDLQAKTLSPTPQGLQASPAEISPTDLPTSTPYPTPTLTATPTSIESPTLSPTPSASPTQEISLSPTVISKLPVTGNITNLLIVFAVSSIVIFFSFIL